MPYLTYTGIWNYNRNNLNLEEGDELIFKIRMISSSISSPTANNVTASFLSQYANTPSLLKITPQAIKTGFPTIPCPVLDSASISASANNNEIIFSTGVSSFYGGDYTFVPNPPTGSVSSSLYSRYGDVDYPFTAKTYDIILIYLSDGTYVEYRIIDAYVQNTKLHLILDRDLNVYTKRDLTNDGQIYDHIILLTRIEDETNAYVVYSKRPGQTSYGFSIPEALSPDMLNNIDTITKEVKQKLLADQQGSTSDT